MCCQDGKTGLSGSRVDTENATIAGTLTQAGVPGTFELTPGGLIEEDTAPTDPLPYLEEEVVFYSGQIKLAGTLTVPEKAGRHPAVILLTGAGPQNRARK